MMGPEKTPPFMVRVRLVMGLFVLMGLVILGRSIYLQLFANQRLENRAERQYEQRKSLKMQRGPVVDRQGRPLAISLPMKSLYVVPQEVGNSLETAGVVSAVLKLNPDRLSAIFSGNQNFVWLKRNAKPTQADLLLDLNLQGIYGIKEYQRFYPYKALSSHLIGFTGLDSRGLEGLEYQYNQHLMDSKVTNETWNPVAFDARVNPISGGGIELTLDLKLQYYVERELEKAVKAMQANFGTAILMESATGEILALAVAPDFDPNNFQQYNESQYFNRAVAQSFEPGSTFKIITMAAALESKAITAESYFFCENGEYKLADRVIHDTQPHGFLNLEKIIQKSSNICAAKIAQLIPKEEFYGLIQDFGFGTKTGVELPGELRGTLHNPKNWTDVTVATLSYGHSISATAMQVLAATNVFANQGVWVRPRVIRTLLKADGTPMAPPEEHPRQVVSPAVAKLVTGYMKSVVAKGGTGRKAYIADLPIAGKTGTSRKFDSQRGEYSSTLHTSSFAGFFPADDPKLTLLVVVDEPQERYLESKSAAIVFREVAKAIQDHYPFKGNLERPDNQEPSPFSPPEVATGPLEKAEALKRMQGKSLRQALALATRAGIRLKLQGKGRVQSLRPQGNDYLAILAE